MKQNYLITYQCTMKHGGIQMCMDITDDIIGWLASVQKYPETYILLNQFPITEAEAKTYNGSFKGM